MYNPLDDLDVMALTVWAEARGESVRGQQAVAWVIKNRWLHPRWWSRNSRDGIPDDTIAAVVRDPWQFSCWNPNDPNRARLDSPKTQERVDFQRIREVCRMVLNGEVQDPTGTADHYCTTAIVRHTRWARGRKPVAVIGNHSFFRLEL
jgi:spore germination cell wall hydrolase CwlJ-like protein